MISPTDRFKNKECIFCKIIAGTLPSEKVYENGHVFAFRDINAQTPVHVLIVPKKHIVDILDVSGEESEIFQHIFRAAQLIA
ncbi:MAG: HIT domain-containing protein, partial [Bdellovibrionales bacterium]|nr:HIT domain-containing protein [Bdellovibrionales bacterium]